MAPKINSIEGFRQAERSMLEQLVEQLKQEDFFEPAEDSANLYYPPGKLMPSKATIEKMQRSILADTHSSSFRSFSPVSFNELKLQSKPKSKKAAKVIYSSPSPGYKWEPQVPAHESILTVKVSELNGYTPEEGNMNNATALPAPNLKRPQIISKIKTKNKTKPVKKSAVESMGSAASKIFAKVSSDENTNAKNDVTLENVRDNWETQLAGQCFKACADILEVVKISPIAGNINQLQMALETSDHTSIHATKDFDRGINYIDEQLDEDNGVRVGVNHTLNYKNGTLPNEPPGVPATTDHYVVIYGRKYDAQKKEYYYLYADVASTDSAHGKSDENRLYLNELTKTLSGVRPFKSSNNHDVIYTVSQVSANEEDGK